MRCEPRRTAIAAILPIALLAGAAPLSGLSRRATPRATLAELWAPPDAGRNLLSGPGGAALAPDPDVRYRVVEVKIGGFSDGYHVMDPSGREWSAKLPPEASPEVVASRIHWGLGYHQPPIYLLREWNADGASAPNPQLPARFREEKPDFHGLDATGSWAFDDNPFLGTRQLAGLLVLEAMLGNSDLKKSNTRIYKLDEPVEGAARWYVVRDLGHTFGRTGTFGSPRGDIEAFEKTGFIRRVRGNLVELDYGGRHHDLFTHITVADVRWICGRLNRLTDRQWQDAFRAGAYEPHVAGRFIAKLKAKIAQGLALPDPAGDAAPERGAQRVNPDARALQEFSRRVQEYADRQRKLDATIPALPRKASPEQIDAHERRLAALVRQARAKARQGDIFAADMQAFVRRILSELLAQPDGASLRGSIMSENPTGLSPRVNERYPDQVPLATTPPPLLRELPELPDELEYRFIGRTLVILDPHAHLIVDFVPDALPAP
jgi:hypothetical protein